MLSCSLPNFAPCLTQYLRSRHLGIAEVHFRMLTHKLLQYVLLLLLFAIWLPLPLHLLIIHHLFDHTARLSIQIAQFAVLRLDLCSVDFGGISDNVCPPIGPGRLL